MFRYLRSENIPTGIFFRDIYWTFEYYKKKKPFYRVVVAQDTSPRDGRFIEILGTYNPCVDPAEVKINKERAQEWISKGALPTQSADQILRKSGVFKG